MPVFFSHNRCTNHKGNHNLLFSQRSSEKSNGGRIGISMIVVHLYFHSSSPHRYFPTNYTFAGVHDYMKVSYVLLHQGSIIEAKSTS